ncbi:MAG: hydrogenase maturation protease [Gammaproteobacteria bacterium]|nr:hydrogenase maturation protease [Gammaproteobacteria bacterium]
MNSTLNTPSVADALQLSLIFIGNPSRGDDAVGPLLFLEMEEWLQHVKMPERNIQLLNTFQLEPELCCDIKETERLIIIDASIIPANTAWMETLSDEISSSPLWTHAMPPTALLALYENIYHRTAPKTCLLHIPGESFELGDTLSVSVKAHQERCRVFLTALCQATSQTSLDRLINAMPAAPD